MPEQRRLTLERELVGVAQLADAGVDAGDLLAVERLVVGRELCELQGPEQRSQRLAAPDRVDDGGVIAR